MQNQKPSVYVIVDKNTTINKDMADIIFYML